MNLGVPQVVVVRPWVARLVPWEAGTGWGTDNVLSLAGKMTRGCPAGTQGPETIEWHCKVFYAFARLGRQLKE